MFQISKKSNVRCNKNCILFDITSCIDIKTLVLTKVIDLESDIRPEFPEKFVNSPNVVSNKKFQISP